MAFSVKPDKLQPVAVKGRHPISIGNAEAGDANAISCCRKFPDVPSDIVIVVDGVSFPLHKFPLFARCSRIRKLVDEHNKTGPDDSSSSSAAADHHHHHQGNNNIPTLELHRFPGGPDAFELTAKFCYGISFNVTPDNIAQLRCAAEYLEMTDRGYGNENLITLSDSLLEEMLLEGVEKAAHILRACGSILPWADEAKIVNRCIDAIACKVCIKQDSFPEHSSDHHHQSYSGQLLNKNVDNMIGHGSEACSSSSPSSCCCRHGNNGGDDDEGIIDPPTTSSCRCEFEARIEWWAEEMSSLRIDLYQRLMAAMRSRGLNTKSLAGSLMHYAQKQQQQPLMQPTNSKSRKKSSQHEANTSNNHNKNAESTSTNRCYSLKEMQEQRIVVESLVSMFPDRKHRMLFPTKFLLGFLRIAITLDTTVACQLDLMHRISDQLEFATVDDLLFPKYYFYYYYYYASNHRRGGGEGESVFDVEVVRRVLMTYLQQQQQQDEDQKLANYMNGDPRKLRRSLQNNNTVMNSVSSCSLLFGADTDHHHNPNSTAASGGGGLIKVARLIDTYLAEIASDSNLTPSEFSSLAQMLPHHSRLLHDYLYRAIDIFLKMHPALPDMERKKLCKLLDCQKLSQEASTHAAKNERLPVEMVVQVLYFEQLRMRTTMAARTTRASEHYYYPADDPVLPDQHTNPNGSAAPGLFHADADTQSDAADTPCPQAPRRRKSFEPAVLYRTSPLHSHQKCHATNHHSSIHKEDGAAKRTDYAARFAESEQEGNDCSMDIKELQLELERLRLRVKELEKENSELRRELASNGSVRSGTKAGAAAFFSVLSRRIGRMSLFSSRSDHYRDRGSSSAAERSEGDAKARTTHRRRRHSVS